MVPHEAAHGGTKPLEKARDGIQVGAPLIGSDHENRHLTIEGSGLPSVPIFIPRGVLEPPE